MSPFDELTEKARVALDGATPDTKGRKTAHVFAELADARRVSCTATAQPAGFGSVRTSFSYRLDGKAVSRETAQSLLNGRAPTAQELRDFATKEATAFGDPDAAESFRKTLEKLGDLDDVEIVGVPSGYEIRGTREGRNVCAFLQRVVKTSSKGKQFEQWPARIYINGEFTPEHIYKKLFA